MDFKMAEKIACISTLCEDSISTWTWYVVVIVSIIVILDAKEEDGSGKSEG